MSAVAAGEPLASNANAAEALKYRREFWIMSVAFGLNHASVTTPLQFATSVLTQKLGYASDCSLYFATFLCCLFFANPMFARLGAKRGLSISMLLYTVYAGTFGLAIWLCPNKDNVGACKEGSATGAMWAVAVIGGLIGGIGAGLLWTSQGAFYAQVCEKIGALENRPKEEVTADFSGRFGIIFLGFEAVVRALTSVLTGPDGIGFGLHFWVAFTIWTIASLVATVGFHFFSTDLTPPTSTASRAGFMDKLLAAVGLWNDPKLWLLQATNITFGFAAAYNGGYIASNITSVALKKVGGASFLGYGGAVLSLWAALLSRIFGPVATKVGKGPILAAGGIVFGLLAILSWIMRGDPENYGFTVVIFYLLMGTGRAVYESTNKAIFADFFPGDKAPGAFANIFVFGTLSSVVTYALGIAAASDPDGPEYTVMGVGLLVFAVITLPCYMVAAIMKRKQSSEE